MRTPSWHLLLASASLKVLSATKPTPLLLQVNFMFSVVDADRNGVLDFGECSVLFYYLIGMQVSGWTDLCTHDDVREFMRMERANHLPLLHPSELSSAPLRST